MELVLNFVVVVLGILAFLWALIGIPAGIGLIIKILFFGEHSDKHILTRWAVIAFAGIPVLIIFGIIWVLWLYDFDVLYFLK